MELGNFIFGYSRGNYLIKRKTGFEEPMAILMRACGLDYAGYGGNSKGFENDIFKITPYWWGDCTCGAESTSEEDRGCRDPSC